MNNDFVGRFKPRPTQNKTPEPKETPSSEPVAEEIVETTDEHTLGEESVMDEAAPEQDTDKKSNPGNPKKKRRNPKQWFLDLTKKQKILFCIGCVIVLAIAGFGAFKLTQKPVTPAQKAAEKKKNTPKPTTVASTLTGVQVSPELNKRGVTGIMIENSEVARPQAGLKDAGVLFEAIAEGGITRFLTLFQEAQPDYIGPVRSVRPYYIDWLQGFDAPIAHAGGSADALAKIRSDGVPDLDQFAHGSYYERVNNRDAPHDLFTSIAKLDVLRASKGLNSSTFTGFPRKKEKASKTPTAAKIDLAISSAVFNPHYDYDAKTNSYKRSLAGVPHTDEKTNTQLSPKVVIAMVLSKGYNAGYTTYQTIGTGHCFIFQDGTVTEGNWEKLSSKDQITFKDARGNTLPLNPGQTWISMVSANSDVAYTAQ